jgi:hypothetical protein
MTRRTVFLVAVALQVALLGWMVAASERTLAHGTRVVLKVQPLDPVDFMTGRFIRATPAIARIDTTLVPIVGPLPSGGATSDPLRRLQAARISVELRQEGELWVAQRLVLDGAAEPARAPFLRGRVTWVDGTHVNLDFGLERFDIPYDADDPTPLSRSPEHLVALVVKVAGDGRGVVEDMRIDGAPFSTWNAAEKAKRK